MNCSLQRGTCTPLHLRTTMTRDRVRKPLRRRHSEMTAFDPIKSSVPEESVRKMPGIRVDGLCDTEAKAPTHVPTINTMSLEPGYGGKVQLTLTLFYRRRLARA